jgi:hypothetical protein
MFADSAVMLTNQMATHITGLDRLDGEVVVVTIGGLLSTGGANGRYTVTGGAIDVPDVPTGGANVVIGLDYTTVIEPNRLPEELTKAIGRVNLRLYNSLGGTVAAGQNATAFAITYDGTGIAQEGGVYTGEVELDTLGDYGLDVPIVISQPDPLPLTILAIVPRFDQTGTP